MNISTHLDENNISIGYVFTFTDITRVTEMERYMKEKEKLAAIGELSANIAHEIRNPLAALRTSIEMLKEKTEAEGRERKIMEIALREMDRLNRIITDFLIYSNPNPPEFKTILLSQVLKEILSMLNQHVRSNGNIKIKYNLAEQVYIRADENKLKQVFWNLALNAVQAVDFNGEVEISLIQKGGFAKIFFKDNGKGIEPANMVKIFYPFFTTKKDGAGLGLAMVYRIVNEHRGVVNVTSKPGEGASFLVVLPLDPENLSVLEGNNI
ncbi:MAG: ATP-binding protein [Candidatus Magnetoovum sp. WYHC-5]|nr:ATP-binding protein [Candidatus Magnetoovum sp. WYHC-5]